DAFEHVPERVAHDQDAAVDDLCGCADELGGDLGQRAAKQAIQHLDDAADRPGDGVQVEDVLAFPHRPCGKVVGRCSEVAATAARDDVDCRSDSGLHCLECRQHPAIDPHQFAGCVGGDFRRL